MNKTAICKGLVAAASFEVLALLCCLHGADQPPVIGSMFPDDNVTLTTSSTPLRVTATDPENKPLTITFYATGGQQAIPGGNFQRRNLSGYPIL